RRVSRTMAGLLIGLAVLVLAGGTLGSLSLIVHFSVLGAHSDASTPIRGGTWTQGYVDPSSLIPNGSPDVDVDIDQALYLPLFYGVPKGPFTLERRPKCPRCRMGVSVPMRPTGLSILSLI
ncbi:MAG: hypothetical protein ACXVB7_20145, partial [Ktedonobacteraceae bacterium]